MSAEDTSFTRLVSLACHDLRTPLATVLGFARTLRRSAALEPPADRYVEMIDAAAAQMTELLDDLSLVARVEAGRWEPTRVDVPSGELAARAATTAVAADVQTVAEGTGELVTVERDAVTRSLAALAVAAGRHGGVEQVTLVAEGESVRVTPVALEVAPILLGQDLRDLGSAVAVAVVRALDGDVQHAGEALVVRLPRAVGHAG